MFHISLLSLIRLECLTLNITFFGHTRILDPLGKVITSIDDERDGIIYAFLDYDIAKQMKQDYYTMLTERRPDVYIA